MLSACRSDIQVSVSADGFNSHTLKRGSFAEVCHWKRLKAPNETFQKRMGFCALPIQEHSVFINLPAYCCSLCGDGTGMFPSQLHLVFRSPLITQVPCREPYSSHAVWARLACESLRRQVLFLCLLQYTSPSLSLARHWIHLSSNMPASRHLILDVSMGLRQSC